MKLQQRQHGTGMPSCRETNEHFKQLQRPADTARPQGIVNMCSLQGRHAGTLPWTDGVGDESTHTCLKS
jgi:hypothetical protein